MVTLYSPEAKVEFTSYPGDGAALFWDCVAPLKEKGLGKMIKESLSQLILSVNHNWLDIYFYSQITSTQTKSLSCNSIGNINKHSALCVGARNIRTLMDNKSRNRPEHHTVLIAQKLSRYNTDITALSKILFAETGALTEADASYTFIWSRKGKNKTREVGVSFAT